MKTLVSTIFLSLLVSSCSLDKSDKSKLEFSPSNDQSKDISLDNDNNQNQAQEEPSLQQKLKSLEEEKRLEWDKIIIDAKLEFEPLREMVAKKCFDCHNSNRELPFYGRVFTKVNPVTKHQVEGLKALDMAEIFPLKANGEPSQISLLKAIRSSVLDRTMPLKSYTFFYPRKKINDQDEQRFLDWIDPLIENIENFEQKYEDLYGQNDIQSRGAKLIDNKCMRCHGNGNQRGGFGGMENLKNLSEKYINFDEAEKSLIYKVSQNGSMPTDPRERLNDQELQLFIDYINSLKD